MKYLALLRGINVGGRIIKMADLKTCFENMGFSDIKTILQTGNVLFESTDQPSTLKQKIETGLTDTFNYPAKVIIVDLPTLRQAIDSFPFKTDPEKHNYIVFLSDDLADEIVEAATPDSEFEQIKAGQNLIYWQVVKGKTLDTSFAKLLTKAKYKEINTIRNVNTLEKCLK